MKVRSIALLFIALLVALATGCGGSGSADKGSIVLATTTSAEDSGILAELVERFEKKYPYDVKAVAVGSGAALFMGSNGDADLMLTHEPKAEREFMDAGNGESQRKIMHNDFLIVGPPSDPAHVKGMKDGAEAVKAIAAAGSKFVSRGDASGTNAMEMSLWERAGIVPSQPWYIESGQGMGPTLRIADNESAYCLADRASYTVLERDGLELVPLVEGDPTLLNQYTLTMVNHEKFPRIEHEGAQAFAKFLEEKETVDFIRDYGLQEYKIHLFYPD
jgi:tungstate transport system substrate-binding protein